MSQLNLPFPERRCSWSDLLTDSSVQQAVGLLQNSAQWQTSSAAIIGAPKSGISTLLLAWCDHVDGHFLRVDAFEDLSIDSHRTLLSRPVAIDDADQCRDGSKLLTLLNLAREVGQPVVLGSHYAPSDWNIEPRDLQSRLNAIQQARFADPDETIVRQRLEAVARERFLHLGNDILNYLVLRMEWRYADIADIVDQLEKKAEEIGRSPSIPLARHILETLYPDNRGND